MGWCIGRMFTKNHPHKNNKPEGGNMSVNKVLLLGRLGRDPELKYTPAGAAVCNFSFVTSEKYKDKKTSEQKEKPEWHRIVVWGAIAETCNQYLKKGSQAFIEGSLQTRSWENKEGVEVYTTEINARSVQFLGGKAQVNDNAAMPEPDNGGVDLGSIPF